ncbi:MAG: NADH-quinone oxidoreductase subunit L [Phycisphaeraceae bacterium]|nr:NADH-quinone oxidoreductase subunit L [Phycisphaeraceae bacterium]
MLEIVQQIGAVVLASGSALAVQAGGHAAEAAHGAAGLFTPVKAVAGAGAVAWVPALTMLATLLCGLCAALRIRTKLPAVITVVCLAGAFAAIAWTYAQSLGHPATPQIAHVWDWIDVQWGGKPAQSLVAHFSFYVDSLTLFWMLFVTGLGTLIALYASEYMAGDVGVGYSRFFAAFNLFVLSMSCLVMADNLILLYLGWEGVGLCSYLLIGYFYTKPSAVAAAKKAFIMNRIGDCGLALGIWLTFTLFGTVRYEELWPLIKPHMDAALEGRLAEVPFLVQLIPVLLTVGAFGKSAQLPLYTWLPDAMEGPTPVSALIHAATMVTAGVYLVARFMPLYAASEWALPIVAWGGGLTAFWAATIGMAQFDIKRVMAYSTISQLGYMFGGLGVLGPEGGVSHVLTHAFFKALLFLACGAVMHGFAGQLDLRKLSGLRKIPGWRIVGFTMLVGCLNLSGFPYITAGFWSKDLIIGDAFVNPHTQVVGWLLLITAGLTSYYTFRVYFRVFEGPVAFEAGEEAHGHGAGDHAEHGHGHGHDGHDAHDGAHAGHGHGEFHPHAPGWAINLVLTVLAVATFAVIPLVFTHGGEPSWAGRMVDHSTANVHAIGHEHATFFGFDPHAVLPIVSGILAIAGILVAWWLHLAGRTTAATSRADALIPLMGPIPRWGQNKWYVDELYHFLFVLPLRVVSHICFLIDKLLVDGLVDAAGWAPRGVGSSIRPAQSGVLNDYAVRMVTGVGAFLLIVIIVAGGAA